MSENFFDSRHYRALSRLHPLQMDLEEYVVCKELDRALESADDVYREIFPSSATATHEKWENLYKLGHSGPLKPAGRRSWKPSTVILALPNATTRRLPRRWALKSTS